MLAQRKYDYYDYPSREKFVGYDKKKREEEEKRERRIHRAKVQKEQARNKRRQFFAMVKLCLVMCICVSMVVMVLVRYAEISESKYKIFELKNQVKQLEMSIQDKKVELDKAIVLKTIESVAVEDLNMVYPREGQIVSIAQNKNFSVKRDRFKEKENTIDNPENVFIMNLKIIAMKLFE
ncbi:MAG: hypothetical protein N4A76_03340 [Firmicutes bacterium]|jgi:cell division protein FtsL|nr:hypothetical protein [Bacillota bacterium]